MRRKRSLKAIVLIFLLLVLSLSATYAVTKYFAVRSVTTNYSRKVFFTPELNTTAEARELSPGETTGVSPTIYNNGTEPMYVFMVLKMPFYNTEPLYTYEVNSGWKEVERTGYSIAYAYGTDEMFNLFPGETTAPLFTTMTMKSISIPEYSTYDDLNMTITCYALGTTDTPTGPAEAWLGCKETGLIEL